MSGVQESTATHINHEQQQQEHPSKDLHTAFGFIIGLLLTLVGVKYQGSGTTLFRENRLIVSLVIMTICLYATALVKTALITRTHQDNHDRTSSNPLTPPPSHDDHTPIFLVAGTIASELLLYVLLTSFGWLLLNILVLGFLALLHFYQQVRNLLSTIFHKKSTNSTQTTDQGSATNDVHEMSDVV